MQIHSGIPIIIFHSFGTSLYMDLLFYTQGNKYVK